MARKKEDREVLLSRVDKLTPDKIKEIAQKLGYTYNNTGSISKLLDAIARGEIILIKSLTNENK